MFTAFMRETAQIVTEHGHAQTEIPDAVVKMAKEVAEEKKAIEKVDRERKYAQKETQQYVEGLRERLDALEIRVDTNL